MIKVQGYVYDSQEHYNRGEIARCRGGMCPYFNLATFVEQCDHGDVARCIQCSRQSANTGSFRVV
jgi:hypothetical protein